MSVRGVAVLAALAAAPVGAAHAAVSLASHHVVYDLALARAPGGDTVAASGTLDLEIRTTCDAWATTQTIELDTVDRDGTRSDTRTSYATFERRDGRALTFTVGQVNADRSRSLVSGIATRDRSGDGATVRFSNPPALTLRLPPGTLFPMAHTAAILDAAQSGVRSLSPLLFDGTGTDGAEYTHATILDWGAAQPPVPNPSLAGMPAGRISIQFYPLDGHDALPQFGTVSRYFADGISDRLDMEFGGFTLAGTVRRLSLLPGPTGCPAIRVRSPG